MTDRNAFIRAATKVLDQMTREQSRHAPEESRSKRREDAIAIQAAAGAVATAAGAIAEALREHEPDTHYHTHNYPKRPDPKDPTLTPELVR